MCLTPPPNVIFDVDGVLTDGSFFYSETGKVLKKFGPHDHDGIKLIAPLINIIFVTADKKGFSITKKRIEDMNQSLVFLSESDRLLFLEEHYVLRESVYVGDGIYDVPILKRALCGIAPANARQEAKNVADYVTTSFGGNGAVLEASLKVLELFFPDRYRQFQGNL